MKRPGSSTLPGRFCVSGGASETLAKLAAPGFSLLLQEIRRP